MQLELTGYFALLEDKDTAIIRLSWFCIELSDEDLVKHDSHVSPASGCRGSIVLDPLEVQVFYSSELRRILLLTKTLSVVFQYKGENKDKTQILFDSLQNKLAILKSNLNHPSPKTPVLTSQTGPLSPQVPPLTSQNSRELLTPLQGGLSPLQGGGEAPSLAVLKNSKGVNRPYSMRLSKKVSPLESLVGVLDKKNGYREQFKDFCKFSFAVEVS